MSSQKQKSASFFLTTALALSILVSTTAISKAARGFFKQNNPASPLPQIHAQTQISNQTNLQNSPILPDTAYWLANLKILDIRALKNISEFFVQENKIAHSNLSKKQVEKLLKKPVTSVTKLSVTTLPAINPAANNAKNATKNDVPKHNVIKMTPEAYTLPNVLALSDLSSVSTLSASAGAIITSQITQTYKVTTQPPVVKKLTEDLPFGAQKLLQTGHGATYVIKLTTTLQLTTTGVKKLTTQTVKKTKSAKPTVILVGQPPKYRTETIDGKKLTYYRKLYVWATSYDSSCRGCNDITATGRKLTYGIVAVDPRVIPLHSCVYVPGYGYAQAEDTGGAIKGNKIDLAFEDIQYGWWSARYTWVYLVDCKDAKLPF